MSVSTTAHSAQLAITQVCGHSCKCGQICLCLFIYMSHDAWSISGFLESRFLESEIPGLLGS